MSDDVQYTLPQAVTFDNLADVRKVAEARIETADPEHTLTIGIGDLGHGGSAAVALMIALFRRAHVKGRNILFTDIPTEIVNIISVSGMTDVLPLDLQETDTELEAKPVTD